MKKSNFDIGQFVDVVTEQSVVVGLVERFKQRRKEMGLSQRGISVKSGVAYASLRRFETTGEISLNSMIKLSDALGLIEEFNTLFASPIIKNLKDYRNE